MQEVQHSNKLFCKYCSVYFFNNFAARSQHEKNKHHVAAKAKALAELMARPSKNKAPPKKHKQSSEYSMVIPQGVDTSQTVLQEGKVGAWIESEEVLPTHHEKKEEPETVFALTEKTLDVVEEEGLAEASTRKCKFKEKVTIVSLSVS